MTESRETAYLALLDSYAGENARLKKELKELEGMKSQQETIENLYGVLRRVWNLLPNYSDDAAKIIEDTLGLPDGDDWGCR